MSLGRNYYLHTLFFVTIFAFVFSCSSSTDSQTSQKTEYTIHYRVVFSDGFSGTVDYLDADSNEITEEVSEEWESNAYQVPEEHLMSITVTGTTPQSEVGEKGSLVVQILEDEEMRREVATGAGEVTAKLNYVTGN